MKNIYSKLDIDEVARRRLPTKTIGKTIARRLVDTQWRTNTIIRFLSVSVQVWLQKPPSLETLLLVEVDVFLRDNMVEAYGKNGRLL